MSKTLAICVAVLFVLSFAGCAGGQSTEPSAIPKTFLTPEPSPSAHLIALPEPTFSAIPEDIQSPSPEPTISAPPDRLNAQTSEPTNTPLIAVM
ncbi:MAG TPA: hypothetical protein DEB24_02250, partial [Coriobacteriia bacterium]|nr:hypothetical protein [Coriobacteriia bacterium]